MGFGQSSAFGGPIHMPTVEGLAKNGLRYNQFHTTALCSPTGAALLTGRNSHMNNLGSITESPGRPGSAPTACPPWRLHQYTVGSTGALPAGKATIRYEFTYEGGGMGKGGTGTLFVNGKSVATGKIDQTQCRAFSADEGADVGADEGTPVTEAYKVPFKFHRQDRQGDHRAGGTAAADEAKKAQKQAALKTALSN